MRAGPTRRLHPTSRFFATLLALLIVLTLMPGATAPGAAQEPATAPLGSAAAQGSVPLDTAVVTGTLDNGLRYFIRGNRRPEARAELRLVVNAGSVLEDESQRGLAHFVEHMAFNGTRNFAKQELVDYLESIGMRFGPDLNAYTSFDETVYMLTVPTDSAGLLERGLGILEDWAWGQTFDPDEVEKERGVVVEEWRLGRGAQARMMDEQLPVLFHGSRYAERLPIGEREVLDSFDVETLERFYRDWYRPDLMAVVAVGDFDTARVEALVRERFSGIPTPARPRPRPEYGLPSHEETLFAIATDPEATGSQVALYHKLPPLRTGTVDAYRERVVERLFLGMLNERLRELTQQADPPFLGAGSGKGSFVGGAEIHTLSASVPDGGIVRGLDALLTEAERVARHGFTSGELERQKTVVLRRLEQAFAEREKTESRRLAGEYIQHFLRGEPAPGIAYDYAFHQRVLPGVTLAEVDALAASWIKDHSRVVLVSAPEKADVPVPDEAELRAAMRAALDRPVLAFEDEVVDEPLVARIPEPTAIVSESEIPELGITEWELANGVRVVLKPTDFQDDQVLLGALSPGGGGRVSDDEYLSAMMAAPVASMSGFGPFSMTELQKKLAGKAVMVSPWISEGEEGFQGQASPSDLETLFQLVYLEFTAPRVDSAAFQSLKSRYSAILTNRGASPEAVFTDTISVTMADYHPRARPLSPELLDELDLGVAMATYRDRFADASDFTFVLLGSFDIAGVRPLVQRYLGGLPSTGRVEERAWVDMDPPPGVIEKTVRKGTEPKASAHIRYTGPAEYSDAAAETMSLMVEVLRIRLRDVLREDMGGTYGVQIRGSLERGPDEEYDVGIQFGTDPDRVEELTAAVATELERLRADGPTPDEMQKVREIRRRAMEVNRERNEYWLSQLYERYRFDEDPRSILEEGERVDAVTAADVREAARRYLGEDRVARFFLYPEVAR